MRLIAVDPGLTIGVAEVRVGARGERNVVQTFQTDDPLAATNSICRADVVVVEDFVGGGPRTKEAIHTLKVCGFVEWYARLLGVTVVLRQPQFRLHKVTEATALVGPGAPHAVDALAHALSYLDLQRYSSAVLLDNDPDLGHDRT